MHICEKSEKNKQVNLRAGKELTYRLAQPFHFTEEESEAKKGK